MDEQFLTIIFAVITGIVFYQLYRVLGQRTGQERPPFDPLAGQSENDNAGAADNVITLPHHKKTRHVDFSDIDAVAPAGSTINQGLRAIRRVDPSFSVKMFMDGVRAAYEMVLTAFANGDTDTLKKLLAQDVYEGFSTSIAERSKTDETVKFSFVGLSRADIASARLEHGQAHIALHLVSEIISATYDKNGQLVDGDPETIVEVRDLWTFSRDVHSNSPNWLLTATQEDH